MCVDCNRPRQVNFRNRCIWRRFDVTLNWPRWIASICHKGVWMAQSFGIKSLRTHNCAIFRILTWTVQGYASLLVCNNDNFITFNIGSKWFQCFVFAFSYRYSTKIWWLTSNELCLTWLCNMLLYGSTYTWINTTTLIVIRLECRVWYSVNSYVIDGY